MHECVCVTDRQTGRAGEPPEQHMLYISPIIITSHSLLIMDQAGWTSVPANRHQYVTVNVHKKKKTLRKTVFQSTITNYTNYTAYVRASKHLKI